MSRFTRILFLGLGMAGMVQAWQAPDTLSLLKSFKVLEREKGKPVVWQTIQGHSGDLKIRLIWKSDSIVEARYIQSKPFTDNEIMDLAANFGGGGTWHELPDPISSQPEAIAYPGIVQQWQLEGFGGTLGWMGAGETGGSFFLIFRKQSLSPVPHTDDELSLNPSIRACQDTLSGWIQEACPSGWQDLPAEAKCFSPTDNPRKHLAFLPLSKKQTIPQWMVLWQEGESLKDISKAMKELPSGSETGYSEDLSRILGGESITFLSHLAAANPCVFKQPSWAIARLKTGNISPREFLPYLGRQGKKWEWLPSLSLELADTHLKVDISLGGTYRLRATPKHE